MFYNCKHLDDKHEPDLPIAWITVTICQDSTRYTVPVACSTQIISIFNTFFGRNILVDIKQIHHI